MGLSLLSSRKKEKWFEKHLLPAGKRDQRDQISDIVGHRRRKIDKDI
jgi:hypothetical protein